MLKSMARLISDDNGASASLSTDGFDVGFIRLIMFAIDRLVLLSALLLGVVKEYADQFSVGMNS